MHASHNLLGPPHNRKCPLKDAKTQVESDVKAILARVASIGDVPVLISVDLNCHENYIPALSEALVEGFLVDVAGQFWAQEYGDSAVLPPTYFSEGNSAVDQVGW
eukprot:4601337-Karenia_brevis.AAC.1